MTYQFQFIPSVHLGVLESGFLLVDENGKVVLSLNISGRGLLTVESLEDRDYFIPLREIPRA